MGLGLQNINTKQTLTTKCQQTMKKSRLHSSAAHHFKPTLRGEKHSLTADARSCIITPGLSVEWIACRSLGGGILEFTSERSATLKSVHCIVRLKDGILLVIITKLRSICPFVTRPFPIDPHTGGMGNTGVCYIWRSVCSVQRTEENVLSCGTVLRCTF